MNPDTVREEKAKGKQIMFGDAAQGEVLKKAGIAKARVLVIVVNDPFGTPADRSDGPHAQSAVHIIVRTRYMGEVATSWNLAPTRSSLRSLRRLLRSLPDFIYLSYTDKRD
jgi:CPA2 family monovalent cation:H+ antiporter-2